MVEIEQMVDDSGHLAGYVTKGHIDAGIFEASIRHQWNDKFELNSRMEHTILRCIPAPPNEREYYSYRLEESPPGRGAFKATVVYLD